MATLTRQVSVGTGSTSLLWQTSTGVVSQVGQGSGNQIQEDPAVNPSTGIFRAGTVNDPVPIVVENLDATNPVYLGGSAVTSGTGVKIAAGGSLTFNAVGNDSVYAIATGASVTVSISAGRQ